MDTSPGISRSGRVLKKSTKLLDMETETIAKTVRQSGTKPGKISIINSNDISNEENVEQQQQQPNTLRLKLNLSNYQQQLPKITGEPIINNNDNDNNINSNTNTNPVIVTTSTPIQIRTTTTTANVLPIKQTPAIGSLIVKINNNDSIKRLNEDSSIMTFANVKRIKSNETEESVPATTTTTTTTKSSTNPIVRIIANPQQQSSHFKSTFSPIIDKTTTSAALTTKTIATNPEVHRSLMPKLPSLLNTSLSSSTSSSTLSSSITAKKVLPLSIQEQRRINQANRARLQLQHQQQLKEELRQKQHLNLMKQYHQSDGYGEINVNQNNSNHHSHHGNKSHKKPAISPYVLWCKENRNHIHSNYPELDFANLSKKMGGIWHTLPKTEKDKWQRKAQLMTKFRTGFNMNALYNFDDEELKPEIVLDSLTLPIIKTLDKTFGENFINTETSSIDGEKHHIGTELIDTQAYLSILGDSLMTISTYIQRGIRYNSDIQYCSMAAISTLLDTALVSMSTLASITLSTIPNNSIDRKIVKKSIENVTYFMPPSEF